MWLNNQQMSLKSYLKKRENKAPKNDVQSAEIAALEIIQENDYEILSTSIQQDHTYKKSTKNEVSMM